MPHVTAERKAYQKAYDARYRAEHPDKRKAYNARYRAKNREKDRARIARYYAKHSKKLKAYQSCYAVINFEKKRASSAKYRARKLSADGNGITERQWRDVLTSTLGLCTYCYERRPLALDHIVPLSTGGEHDINNAVPACNSCNSSKQKTPLLLWLARRAA